jgi:hypothetical protein
MKSPPLKVVASLAESLPGLTGCVLGLGGLYGCNNVCDDESGPSRFSKVSSAGEGSAAGIVVRDEDGLENRHGVCRSLARSLLGERG